MKHKLIVVLFFLMGILPALNGQGSKRLDSLLNESKKPRHDTLKSKLYYAISQEYRNINADKSLEFANKGMLIAKKHNQHGQIANFYVAFANAYFNLSQYVESEKNFRLAYSMAIRQKDTLLQAIALNGIGLTYEVNSDYDNAIKYYIKSIKVSESINDLIGVAYCNVNIGVIYQNIKHYELALEYTFRGLEVLKQLNDGPAIGSAYGNIGSAYHKLKDYKNAEKYLQASVDMLRNEGLTGELSTSENSLGFLFFEMGKYDKALQHYQLSYELGKESGDLSSQAIALCNIGHTYIVLGDLQKGKEYNDRAYELAGKHGVQDLLAHLFNLNAEMYAVMGDYKMAYEFQKRYSVFSDSLNQLKSTSQLHEMQAKYDLDKKQQKILLLKKNDELNQEKLKRANVFRNWSIALGIAGVVILIVVYMAYSTKKKSNLLLEERNSQIEKQRLVLEVKNKEITDSITYAKRLQEAILPSQAFWQVNLPQSFIYYVPKDIVAGDFYWMEFVQEKKSVIFAAADCTGHGVPGAMVSVVCANALNRAVKEFHLTEPGIILNKVREMVIETFAKSDANVKDGMDISICTLKLDSNELQWSGANNPLWIIRDKQCVEIIPDKQPIGIYHELKPFTTHTIELLKNDLVVLFTDGFADQFGGEKGKKFKYSNFQKLLIKHSELLPLDIREQLAGEFVKWKGDMEQTDDVCVIGVRIS